MTDKEIIRALRCGEGADGTPRPEPSDEEIVCYDPLKLAAADLIERLEKEKAALISTIGGFCQWCKNLDADENSCRVWTGCSICDRKCPCAGCRDGSKWEWKGLEDTL